MEPKFQVQLKIQKPVSEVFQAVVDPVKLSGYFVKTASGPMAEGQTVMWSFVEAPEPFPVTVVQVQKDARIVFRWGSAEGGDKETTVEVAFKPLEGGHTMVQISESGWSGSPVGIKSSYDNCGGWMHMMCAMKAYLEYGINLRAGGAM
jgi:uncharacterized protein YndB with AHSA1/START domain